MAVGEACAGRLGVDDGEFELAERPPLARILGVSDHTARQLEPRVVGEQIHEHVAQAFEPNSLYSQCLPRRALQRDVVASPSHECDKIARYLGITDEIGVGGHERKY